MFKAIKFLKTNLSLLFLKSSYPFSTCSASCTATARHRFLEARCGRPGLGPGPVAENSSAPDDVTVNVWVLYSYRVDHVQQVLGVHRQHVRRGQHAPGTKNYQIKTG